MFKHILVPLDGSLLAKTALNVATQLVNPSCKITLVYAIKETETLNFAGNPITINPEYYPTLETLENNGKRYLEEIAEPLRQDGYHVTTKSEVGDPADCIIYTATKLEVDAIVMSTHGRSGVNRWLFGSVTGKVLSRAICPVLVVPSQQIQHQHDQKLAEMNFS
jgi:nucleotide-binding universal stress UspA family protein